MPRSKRNKVVSLTNVKKKGRGAKEEMVENIKQAVDGYKRCFALSFENIRTGPFKKVQNAMRDSKFFIGKNKVMQVALGRSPEEESADNTHLLSKYLRGQVCMLFTNKTEQELHKFLAKHEEPDFAKAGAKATHTVFLQKGAESLSEFGHGMEPYFRQLGLPTKLNMQKIELLADTFVCREGEVLNVEQCKILKLLGHQMAKFELKRLVVRDAKGKIKEFEAGREYLLKLDGGDSDSGEDEAAAK